MARCNRRLGNKPSLASPKGSSSQPQASAARKLPRQGRREFAGVFRRSLPETECRGSFSGSSNRRRRRVETLDQAQISPPCPPHHGSPTVAVVQRFALPLAPYFPSVMRRIARPYVG